MEETSSHDVLSDSQDQLPYERRDTVKEDTESDERNAQVRKIGRFTLRGKTDDLPQNWWFASTAIPLLAATIGPLANVLSIAALVTKWRVTLPNNGQLPEGADNAGVDIPDPQWAFVLNCVSLGLGVFGNVFLLLNFVQRARYIVALPVTIIAWYFATAILIGITISMQVYVPPVRPSETYSQGFWHAIIAATLYLIGSILLMVNMLGYFLGHYPQHFDLDDHQRTLILQTMMFFFWLAGGAAVFAKVCGMSYVDALYFCDVTVLTVGFGDLLANNDIGRGLVFPYSVFGIIFLGLMINSIHQFAMSISRENVIKKHALNERERTFDRTVTNEKELRERLDLELKNDPKMEKCLAKEQDDGGLQQPLNHLGRFEVRGQNVVFRKQSQSHRRSALRSAGRGGAAYKKYHMHSHQESSIDNPLTSTTKLAELTRRRRNELLLLREERDRFNAMREIQARTTRFKSYYSLSFSVLAFTLLWCVGAAVFFVAEQRVQGLSYFQCLYFCYVSLLTIGYGDYSPKSNAGKPFFVLWSLMAVPTMTILVSDLGDTVVKSLNRGTFTLADWTIMPKRGVWHKVVGRSFALHHRASKSTKNQKPLDTARATEGIRSPTENGSEEAYNELNTLVMQDSLSDHELAQHLARAIGRVVSDLRSQRSKKYTYEDWVGFSRLIRFSAPNSHRRPESKGEKTGDQETEDGFEEILEWDWIGEDSPMLTGLSESEWVLERLCESLDRYTKRQASEAKQAKGKHQFKLTSPTFPIAETDGIHEIQHFGEPVHLAVSSMENRGRAARSSETRRRSISPVLSRGPSGVEIVNLSAHAKEPHKSSHLDQRVSLESAVEEANGSNDAFLHMASSGHEQK